MVVQEQVSSQGKRPGVSVDPGKKCQGKMYPGIIVCVREKCAEEAEK